MHTRTIRRFKQCPPFLTFCEVRAQNGNLGRQAASTS